MPVDTCKATYNEYGGHLPRSPDGVNTLTDLFSAGNANYAEFGRTTLIRLRGD